MMVAHADVEIAKLRTKQTQLSRYPTVNMKGSLSQAVNGRNPNNSQDNGFYSSIMLEANSHFYQGGATGAQIRAASFAEEAAKAKVNQIYLETMDRVRLIQAEVQNKKRQMNILTARAATTARTKELYQEQYKLGTRTVVDLLNAEQAIHSAAQEIENVRYDIYSSVVQYIAATGKTRQLYQLNNTLIQGVEVKP
jgi:adhesin transport system outer membrane protein